MDLDDLDLVCIHPLPSWVWYQDMAWLADNSLVDDDASSRFLTAHPDPDLP